MRNISHSQASSLAKTFANGDFDKDSWYISAMERLVDVVQQLSHARDLQTIMIITRDAARSLTGADGATFVLRDGSQCYYAEENAISPLWKGSRFPMSNCISGWVMLNSEPAVIEDIYADPRIPHDAYRPTFVKSLAMVPIRKHAPIGAIGNYWSTQHVPSAEEIAILQALANTTSMAMENVGLYEQLQKKVHALEDSNHELSRFAWVASHDLQEPLRTISTQIGLLSRRYSNVLDYNAHTYINLAIACTRRLQTLIEDLLIHSSIDGEQHLQAVDTAEILQSAVFDDMQTLIRESNAQITYDELPVIWANPILAGRLFQNIISNAIKFVTPGHAPKIHISVEREGEFYKFGITDKGIGIDPMYHEKIFELFHRQHSHDIYSGSGIGLATSKKIIESLGGKIWVESNPNESSKGSSFYFTLTPATGT